MEARPETSQDMHPTPAKPVPIAGGQALNDRGQRDRRGIGVANLAESV